MSPEMRPMDELSGGSNRRIRWTVVEVGAADGGWGTGWRKVVEVGAADVG
jgi:hypothetical protein